MAIEQRALVDARVDVRYSYQHADAAVGQLLGPLDLVEIARGVIVNRGPEKAAQVGEAVGCGEGGLGLDGGEFGVGTGREIGVKSVLDHGGVGGGDQIEVEGVIGRHGRSCSWARNARLTRRRGGTAGLRVCEIRVRLTGRRTLPPFSRGARKGWGTEAAFRRRVVVTEYRGRKALWAWLLRRPGGCDRPSNPA